jgi:ribosome recycling factor
MINRTLVDTEKKMQTAVGGLRKELTTIRTGRATPALIEHLKIDYSGVPTPLNQIASISAQEARLLVIQPWDKGSLQAIERAILKSDLGLNPSSAGNIIRLAIPPLSEERRQELIKVVRKRIEERRIIIRNLRHDTLKELREMEKNKDISQDEHKRAREQLQRLTDRFIADAEEVGRDKEKELVEV